MKIKPQNHAELKNDHTPQAIKQRLSQKTKHTYIKDFIYGAVDGTVTTFAIICGVAGAQLSSKVILILGVANLIGDGFSMAVSNYLGTRAEEQLQKKAQQIEEQHIREIPEGEKEEIRQIFHKKGFRGEQLEEAVKIITSNPRQWINMMLQEELGFPLQKPSPLKAGLSTFVAFILVGIIPLLPFIIDFFSPNLGFNAFYLSVGMTAVAFFIIGALKATYIGYSRLLSGLETLMVGGLAALLAYLTGYFLKMVVGS